MAPKDAALKRPGSAESLRRLRAKVSDGAGSSARPPTGTVDKTEVYTYGYDCEVHKAYRRLDGKGPKHYASVFKPADAEDEDFVRASWADVTGDIEITDLTVGELKTIDEATAVGRPSAGAAASAACPASSAKPSVGSSSNDGFPDTLRINTGSDKRGKLWCLRTKQEGKWSQVAQLKQGENVDASRAFLAGLGMKFAAGMPKGEVMSLASSFLKPTPQTAAGTMVNKNPASKKPAAQPLVAADAGSAQAAQPLPLGNGEPAAEPPDVSDRSVSSDWACDEHSDVSDGIELGVSDL